LAKIEEVAYDSVLHDSHDEDHIRIRPLALPKPIYGIAIEATKRYLHDFGWLQRSTTSDRELYDAMTERYPDWVSHQAWLMFGLAPAASR
jgi:hypothetical protein